MLSEKKVFVEARLDSTGWAQALRDRFSVARGVCILLCLQDGLPAALVDDELIHWLHLWLHQVRKYLGQPRLALSQGYLNHKARVGMGNEHRACLSGRPSVN